VVYDRVKPTYAIIDNEITTTTTVTYNQIIGTIPTLLIQYTLLTLLVVLNIITYPRDHYNTQTKE
jgi:hypothetical protein